MSVAIRAEAGFRSPFSGPNRDVRPNKLAFFEQNPSSFVVHVGLTKIDVVTAKKPGQPWLEVPREHIETARGSYRVTWGAVPSWDRYDRLESTHNYIAYVEYPVGSDGEIAYEAISNRMVFEDPEDLSFYQANGSPLYQVLKARLDGPKKPVKIAAESRIGSIRPPNTLSNQRTLEAFTAIKLKMVQDALDMGAEYIACQLRHEMAASIFSVNGIQYTFPPTEKLLGLPEGSVKLNRQNPAVVEHILHYPGYFLDTGDVFEILKGHIEEGQLTQEILARETGLDRLDAFKKPRNLKEILGLLSSQTPLGDSLRSAFINSARDGIYSSCSNVDDIQDQALAILRSFVKNGNGRH